MRRNVRPTGRGLVDYIFLEVNTAFEEMTGLKKDNFMGKPLFESLSVPLAKQAMEYLELAHETGKLHSFEYSLDMDNGLKHFEARINSIDRERSIVIVRDITFRKEAEESQKRSVTVYRNALEGMIESMGCLLEKRDPYTARHQLQVARLAVDIAEEMGLTEEQLQCLEYLSMLSDAGPIYLLVNFTGAMTP